MKIERERILVPPEAAGERLSDWLFRCGYTVASPCGGRGVCGKCRVTVVTGTFCRCDSPDLPALPDDNGQVLACQVLCSREGAEILLPVTQTEVSTGSNTNLNVIRVGVALDIGTTTLAAALVDLNNGQTIASASVLNPQQHFGADVISRIGSCKAGNLYNMQTCLLQSVRVLLERLKAPELLPVMTVVGNPTMLHIFCGISPEGMGAYPFTPAFLDTRQLSGTELGLPVDEVVVLPSVSAFVGSDVTAGALACGLMNAEKPAILVDIGTNGEMMLYTGREGGNRLIATSTAAGPALEGANISCGIGGVDGAVSRVWNDDNGNVCYRTIGDAAPIGICGCGLLDTVSCLLQQGILDESGYLEDDPYYLTGIRVSDDGAGVPSETTVSLTGRDIRELQLAKSALRAGMEALLSAAGLTAEQISATYLAGGLGYYLDPDNAVRIGLFANELRTSVSAVGNSALAGAALCAAYPEKIDELQQLAHACEVFDLNASAVFHEGFIEYMMFPESEEE